MRAAIYSPYLETLGGGERYVISVAKILSDAGWSVDLESKDEKVIEKLGKRFGMELSGINVVDSIKRGDGYDACFWLSDGSVPTLLARKNILHFQRPFFNVDGKSLINRMKLFRINKVVVNSKFTKKWIDREFPVESIVVYPPVDAAKFKSQEKKDVILYVGRFSQLEQSKRQDILVRAFKKLYDKGNGDWRLALAGGSDVGRTKYVESLKESSKGYPIKIYEGLPFKEIKKLFAGAKIFWSAAGYGVNEKKLPQKLEHFGITIVEAMASGCIPVVFDGGGHKEIVKDGRNGYLWKTPRELLGKTTKLIEDSRELKKLSLKAQKDAGAYSYERFKKEFLSLL